MQKASEKLSQDAQEKKNAFLQAQSQVNDAMSLADQTRKEADKLRKEIEDAEVAAATAASMAEAPKPVAQPPAAYPATNGGGFPTPYAMPPASGGFMGAAPMGYNPNVMGGGGGIDMLWRTITTSDSRRLGYLGACEATGCTSKASNDDLRRL